MNEEGRANTLSGVGIFKCVRIQRFAAALKYLPYAGNDLREQGLDAKEIEGKLNARQSVKCPREVATVPDMWSTRSRRSRIPSQNAIRRDGVLEDI
jgi:hypothetical protein